ncbi:MAG TPA: insulinase family protein [bacterium]
MKRAWLLLGLTALSLPCLSRTEVKVFKNGLRLIVFDTGRPSAITSAVILVGTGEANGPEYLATMTNQMLLSGTEIRNRQQINQEVESVSGRIGGLTTLSLSALTVQAPVESFQTCFNILCECATRASFDSSEAIRLGNFSDETAQQGSLFFTRKGFWADAPLRAALFSGSELVRELPAKPRSYSVRQMTEFYGRWYRPENTVIAVTGKIDKSVLQKTVQSFWDGGVKRPAKGFAFSFEGRVDSAEAVLPAKDNYDYVWIGFRAPAFMAPGYLEMFILEMALANGSASYFHNRVFADKQDRIAVQSYYQAELGWGYFVLMVKAPAGEGHAIKRTVLSELEKIKRQGLPESCFELGVRKATSKIAIASQFTLLNASFAAITAAGGNAPTPLSECNEILRKLTLDEVNRAARSFFIHPAAAVTRSAKP